MLNKKLMVFLIASVFIIVMANSVSAWCIFGFGTTCVNEQNDYTLLTTDSKVVFIQGDLEVSCDLSSGAVKVPEEMMWVKGKEFGANVSLSSMLMASEDTGFEYKWRSNKEIKYDSRKDYYYVDEVLVEENDISKIYTRTMIDVSGICDNTCKEYNVTWDKELKENITTCIEVREPECSFELQNVYYEVLDKEMNATYQVFNYSQLTTSFIGFYDSVTEEVFIDPSYTYTNISLEATLNTNIRSEAPFSHLALDNESLILYMPFDHNDSTGNVYDYSVNDNDGEMKGFADNYTRTGYIGGGYDFDGSDDYIIQSNGFETSQSWWYKSSGGSWTHYVNASEVYYINGAINTSTMVFVMNETGIGMNSTGFVDGLIDEVAVFDINLSVLEVNQLYNYTFQKFYQDGNQTFNLTEVSLGTDNRANVTVKAQVLNDSKLSARVYEANLTDSANPSTSYVNTEDDLVLNMHFDNWTSYGENATYVYDFSGQGNNGTVVGGNYTTADGKYGSAMMFDGTNDWVTIANSVDTDFGSADFSIDLWVYQTSIDSNDFILVSDADNAGFQGYALWGYAIGGGNYKMAISSAGASWDIANDVNVGTPILNTWVHLALVRNGNRYDAYLNGISQANWTNAAGVMNADELGIGYTALVSTYINGYIDELHIWKGRALTATEIKSLYLTGSTNHTNNGVGINYTESSSGVQELVAGNSTHRTANFTILPASEYLLTDVEFNSTNGFYSSIVENLRVDTFTFSGADTTNPTYSDNQTNNTIVDLNTNFSIQYNDDTALESNGGYIFSTNNTGTWVNESLVLFTSTPEWANVTKTLNSTVGNFISYRWFANDSAGNDNNTIIFNVTTTSATDTTKPTFLTIPNNITGDYLTTNVEVTFVRDDETGNDSIWINDTSNFTMVNATGVLTNNTPLFVGNYALNVTINDTSGNINFTIFTVQVSQAIGVVDTQILNVSSNGTIQVNNEGWLIGILTTGVGDIDLYYNDSQINTGASPLSNLTNFTQVKDINVTTFYSGNANYTSAYETWWINVTAVPPAPVFAGSYVSYIYPNYNYSKPHIQLGQNMRFYKNEA